MIDRICCQALISQWSGSGLCLSANCPMRGGPSCLIPFSAMYASFFSCLLFSGRVGWTVDINLVTFFVWSDLISIAVRFPSIRWRVPNWSPHGTKWPLVYICIRRWVSGGLVYLIVGPALPTHVRTGLELYCTLFTTHGADVPFQQGHFICVLLPQFF